MPKSVPSPQRTALAAAIAVAGFSRVECDAYLQDGPGWVQAITRPHICGIATR